MNFYHSAISAMECNIEYYIVLLLYASIIIIQQQKIILGCPPKGLVPYTLRAIEYH